MSDHESQASASDIFAGAAHAADFIEDDTIMPDIRQRPRRSQAGDEGRLIDLPQFQQQRQADEESAAQTPAAPQTPPSPLPGPAAQPAAAGEQPTQWSVAATMSGPPPAAPAEDDDDDDELFVDPARLLSSQATVQPTAKATKGLRGALARVGLNVKPSAAEVKEREHEARLAGYEAQVRQATYPRCVRVLVANKKGGTGKTPTAVNLAGCIASVRGGQTAVWEVSDDPGALTYRTEGEPTYGLGELVRDVDKITSAGQLGGYTAPQTSFAAVIGSVGRRPRLTRENVVAVSGLLDEFYAVQVMDSGNQPTSSAFQGAAEVADVLVIPLLNAGDSALEAVQLLDELRAGDEHSKYLADHAIAVRLTDGRMEHDRVSRSIEKLLHRNGVQTLVQVPFDQHIAERGQITYSKLQPATREAFVTLAAHVVTAAQAAVRKA
jgi:cellulose biosynthesis protein BcsQ